MPAPPAALKEVSQVTAKSGLMPEPSPHFSDCFSDSGSQGTAGHMARTVYCAVQPSRVYVRSPVSWVPGASGRRVHLDVGVLVADGRRPPPRRCRGVHGRRVEVVRAAEVLRVRLRIQLADGVLQRRIARVAGRSRVQALRAQGQHRRVLLLGVRELEDAQGLALDGELASGIPRGCSGLPSGRTSPPSS